MSTLARFFGVTLLDFLDEQIFVFDDAFFSVLLPWRLDFLEVGVLLGLALETMSGELLATEGFRATADEIKTKC